MFFPSYHKTTPAANRNDDQYNNSNHRIDIVPALVSADSLQVSSRSQSNFVAGRNGGAGAGPSFNFSRSNNLNALPPLSTNATTALLHSPPASVNTPPGRYNLLPLKSLANLFSNQILSLAKFENTGSCGEENELMLHSAGRAVDIEQQQVDQEHELSATTATDSNEDFMKFTEIFNYLSEEEDFEPSSSSSSSPSPTPSTSPLSSTFSLSLSASNSSMSSLRAKATNKLDEHHLNVVEQSASLNDSAELTHNKPELDDVSSVCSKKSGPVDMDNVSIDSLPLSSDLSSSLMSVNTISSSTSTPASLEYSSSLPASSTLAEQALDTSDQKPASDDSSEASPKSLSSSTPALSLTKPSPEFVVESLLGLNSNSSSGLLKSKPIWSSALYLPCLHPALFELNSAHSMACCLSSIGDSKQLNVRKYDLTPQTPTPCVSWSCMLEANDFNPFISNNNNNNANINQLNSQTNHISNATNMTNVNADLNLKFLNENRFASFNNPASYNVEHNDFINFKSLAQLRTNLNFINKYFQSNYSATQMNEFNRQGGTASHHLYHQHLNQQHYHQQQQGMNDVDVSNEYFASTNSNDHHGFQQQQQQQQGQQIDSLDFTHMNNASSFGNSNFNNRMNSNGASQNVANNNNNPNGYNNSNHSNSYFNSNYRSNAFNRSSKRRYRNNAFNQFNQQYQQTGTASSFHSQPQQRNSLIIDDASFSHGHYYESDSLPASNRHSMVIGGEVDFDVYKLKSNLRNMGEDTNMGSLPALTTSDQEAAKMSATRNIENLESSHQHSLMNNKNNEEVQQFGAADYADYSNDFGKMNGRTMSNKFLAPRFEKKWMDQYQNGNNSGFYASQKDDMSLSAAKTTRNHSFRMSNNLNNNNNNNNSMGFNGKFFTMPAKKNSNNFNYNSQFNLNHNTGGQQQQSMSTSLYNPTTTASAATTSTSSSSSATSPTSSPPTRHMLRRQNAIRLNHNQRYQHQNSNNNNYQFQSSSNGKSGVVSSCGIECQQQQQQDQQQQQYRYNHHHYNSNNNNNSSRYRSLGQGMTANNAPAANKTSCRC